MNNLKHTPGPWMVNNKVTVFNGTGYMISQPGIALTDEEREANAKLIAASPELLEALQKAKEFIGCCADWTGEDPPCELIDSAINKAIGIKTHHLKIEG